MNARLEGKVLSVVVVIFFFFVSCTEYKYLVLCRVDGEQVSDTIASTVDLHRMISAQIVIRIPVEPSSAVVISSSSCTE